MKFSLQSTSEPGPAAPAPIHPATPPPSSLPATPLSSGLPPRKASSSRKPRHTGRNLLIGLFVVVIAGVVVVASVPGLTKPIGKLFGATGTEIVVFPVKKGPLVVTINEKGSLESAKNEDVMSQVEGTTTIIMIKPEGTKVSKGDVVCELDSASLKDTLKNQQITTEQAKASFQQATLTREVAEVAVREYIEGTFKQDLETVQGEIALAEADLARSVDRLKWSTEMAKKGYVSEAAKQADKLSLDKSRFSFEQAQTKKIVLEKFSREKNTKEFQAEVEKAISDELAKKATYGLEKSKEEKLERQIAACTLRAPGDGLVVYANDPNRFGGQNSVQIEEGASVRERQKIFSLPDITQMRVNTKVHESMVDRVKKGMRSGIRVDAFATIPLTGTVQSVAPLPDPNSFFGSDIKVYTTQVAIENGPTGLRPGMTAQVEILIDQIPDVLSIPVQAVLEFKGKDYVFIKKGDGFDRAEVTTGTSNDKLVEIKKGIAEGDLVAMTPTLLMSDDDKREAFGNAGRDAGKKDWGADAKGAVLDKGDGKAADGKAAGKGEPGKEKAKGKRKGAGGALGAKFQKMDPEERTKMFSASDEEKAAILKKNGFTDEEIEQVKNFRGGPPGGGGGPGGPGGGGGGGGFGGGPPQ